MGRAFALKDFKQKVRNSLEEIWSNLKGALQMFLKTLGKRQANME